MNNRIVLIRHDDSPPDDRVVTWFRNRNVEPEIVRPYLGETLGEADGSVAASVLYGGPFNVFETDRHPFLKDEHRWIETAGASRSYRDLRTRVRRHYRNHYPLTESARENERLKELVAQLSVENLVLKKSLG